jgi:hypothetical protein
MVILSGTRDDRTTVAKNGTKASGIVCAEHPFA